MIYIVLFLLVFLSGFFSSIETALYSMGEARIREWSEDKMKQLKYWISEPAGVVTGILVGNNMINISFSAIFTVIIAGFVSARNLPSTWTEVISIAGSSVIILTFAEIIPKTFANTYPEKIITVYYRPFIKFYIAIRTASDILNKISFALVGRLKSRKEKIISRKELHMEIKDAGKEGLLEKEFSKMLAGVIVLSQKKVKEVMTPAAVLTAVDLGRPYSRIMGVLSASKFSRVPAYYGKLDNLKGFIYIKDVIGELNSNGKVNFEKILRSPSITRQNKSCRRLFQQMRKERVHGCIVKNKTRVVGIVTIEDLIEEVVGEIYDEYDNNAVNNN